MNDLLLLLGMIIVVGSAISVYKKAFRSYWIFALITATLLAFLYQVLGYLEVGYLELFFKIAFVMSWIAFFAIVSVGYVAYLLVKRRRAQERVQGE